jgi:uncharacterized membrane protein (UPF0182 family)
MWARYHLSSPSDFYQRNLAWNVAQNPPKAQQSRLAAAAAVSTPGGLTIQSAQETRVPPYYTMMVQPKTSNLEFVSLRSFVPFSDDDQLKTLSAFMTASSDPSDYGKLRVYELQNPLPDGPSIADSGMKSQFAAQLTLLDQAGSQVTFGDQQLLPIGNSLLYVRPWYVQATGQTPVPVLNAVTVTYGKTSYKGDTLEAALKSAFAVNLNFDTVVPGTGATPGNGNGTGTGATTTAPPTGASTTAPSTTVKPTTTTGESVEQLIASANAAYAQAQAALKNGDLGTYQKKLNEAYQDMSKAASFATSTTVTAKPPPPTAPPSTTANA